VDHLNETLADSGFHYTVQTWQRPKPEARETELERWVRENQLDDCPFCRENWPNLYMMALPIHIGPYGVGRGNAVTAAAPSGVVTFLFTDIEGSTRWWEADADGMRAALAAHDEVLRSAIEAHGGWLFKHTVDGVCAARSSRSSSSSLMDGCGPPSGPRRLD
jgi:hypothetical protein